MECDLQEYLAWSAKKYSLLDEEKKKEEQNRRDPGFES